MNHCAPLVVFIVLVNAVSFIVFGASLSETSSEDLRIPRAASTLKFIVIVTRHGNRPPLFELGDLYPRSNTTYWPLGISDITKVGHQEMYEMGMKLSSLYKGFLGTQFFNDEVYATSTPLPRAVQSGKCFMTGLYVPTGGQIWNETLLWQPVPVHQDSLDNTPYTWKCARFETELKPVIEAFEEKWSSNISHYTNYVSEELDIKISGASGVVKIWDTLLSAAVEGYTLPDWAAKLYPDGMHPMMNDQYIQYVAGTDELINLVIGPFFNEMMHVVESKINGTLKPNRHLYYYSGHDDTLITLQAVLGLPQDKIVGVVTPGSAMAFEIHQDTNTKKHFIQIIYIDGCDPDLKVVELNIPNCGSPCQFTKFKKNTAKYRRVTSKNYQEECNK